MDKNKVILSSVIVICTTIGFLGLVGLRFNYLEDKEIESSKNVYDKYTFYIRSAMDK